MRILAVEDEDAIAQMYRWIFEDDEVVIVASVQAALDALDTSLPDLMILDYGLGQELASALAPAILESRVPTVVVSADTRAEAFANEIGAPLVWKPFDTDRLLAVVGKLRAACGTAGGHE